MFFTRKVELFTDNALFLADLFMSFFHNVVCNAHLVAAPLRTRPKYVKKKLDTNTIQYLISISPGREVSHQSFSVLELSFNSYSVAENVLLHSVDA